MSSREMMPPPPPQLRRRDKVHSGAPPLPVERATQHHEIYDRSPNTSTSQHMTGEIDRTKSLVNSRALDMSNPPIRLKPTNINQAHTVYNSQMIDQVAYDEPSEFATINSPLGSSFGVIQRPIVHQQVYMPEPPGSQQTDRTGRISQTRNTRIEQHLQRPMRQPLRPVYINDTGLQTPKRTSYPSAGLKPFVSPLRTGRPNPGSISSPFFQRDASASQITSRQKPLPRGDIFQTRAQHNMHLEATARSQWLQEPDDTSNVRDQFRLGPRHNPSSDYGSFAPPPPKVTLPYRESMAASQISGDLQPPYNTHSYASSMRSPAERQFNPESRGRITLPPSKSNSQEYELSSIRGLRGGHPQRAEGFPGQQHQGYTGSRPLFSAASRRSVRR